MRSVVDKSASIEVASLGNQGVNTIIGELGLKKGEKKADSKEPERIKDSLEHITDSDDPVSARTDVLRALMQKVGDAGLVLGQMDKGKDIFGDDNLDDLIDDKTSRDIKDSVQLKNSSSKSKMMASILSSANIDFGNNLSTEQKSLLQQYAMLYSEYMVSEQRDGKTSRKVSEKLEKLISQLKNSGVSEEKIFSVQKQVRLAVRSEIATKIKESFLSRDLAGGKIQSLMASASADSLVSSVFFNKKLGGWNFGAYKNNLQGTVDEANAETADELSKFALEEIEGKLIGKLVRKDKSTDDLKELIELSIKSGVDLSKWADEVWNKRKTDLLGVARLDLPETNEGTIVNTNADGNNSGAQNGQEESKDEKELLVDQLRALYLQRFIKGDALTYVSTQFKIFRVKNGLQKMGIFSKSLDEKVSLEAESLAKVKIMEMIQEAVMEKATFYKLKGPAYDIVQKNIDNCMKAGARIGMHLTKEDVDMMQTNANHIVLDLISEQIRVISYANRGRKSDKIAKIVARLQSIEQRLLSELSGKTEEIKEQNEINSEVI